MQLTGTKLFYLLTFMALIVLGFWLADNIEQVTIKEHVGYQGEAKNNQYLAFEYFVSAYGYQTQRLHALSVKKPLPPTGSLLLIATKRSLLGQQMSRNLIDWVVDGGHLVITAEAPLSDTKYRDNLLDPLGLQLQSIETTIEEETIKSYQFDGEELMLDLYHFSVLFNESEMDLYWALNDEHGIHAAQFILGGGTLTLFNSLYIFNNEMLSKADHARLLHGILSSFPDLDQVYYTLDDDYESLFSWLWNQATLAFILFMILLSFIIWNKTKRFGPILNRDSISTIRFIDHIKASGVFLWKNQHANVLLNAARTSLLAKIRLRFPEWDQLSLTDQVEKIQSVVELDKNDITTVLSTDSAVHSREFKHIIRTMEKIRKTL